jgi:prepilin-type N-terminal cleavage/methylation domain-containing protein/prepilin-type processing-associated H-X9-DG protein
MLVTSLPLRVEWGASGQVQSRIARGQILRYKAVRLAPSVYPCKRTDGGASVCGMVEAMRNRSAFSLIELLVTVAIILILSTLYFGPNTSSRQLALKRSCQRNLEKLYVSLQIYANDYHGQFPAVTGAKTSEEALGILVPKYTSDTSPFICPGSKDSELPSGESFQNKRISYAYYMGRYATNAQQVVMSDRQVNTQPKAAGESVFSTTGKAPGNNHRKFGGNFLFCDGHCEMSSPAAPFPLGLTNHEVLLNP